MDSATSVWRERGLEFGLLALVIAVASGVIWGIIQFAFPRGAALHDPGAAVPDAAPAVLTGSQATSAPATDFEGVIATLRRTVQMRARSQLAWADARLGQSLHTDDGIQTLAGASAIVRVRGQGDIRIGENSLVVFEANGTEPFLASHSAVAAIEHGEMTGNLTAGADGDALGIRLPNAAVRVQGVRPGQAADFRLQVNRDKSAAMVILRGRAQVRAAGGTRRLGSGEGIRISADGRQVEMQAIPPVPELVEPAADQVIVYDKARPTVQFRWRSAAPVDDYRLLLADDREFRHVLLDERMTEAGYAHAGLRTGDYFWKVSSRRGWLESAATRVAALRVERDIDVRIRAALADLYQNSGEAKDLAGRAQGLLVFPNVIKGGLVIGGEYGEGALLARGRTVDYYTVKSASIGLQLGGQTRKMVLMFMTPEVYNGFVASRGWKVGVDGSVALATLGAAKKVEAINSHEPIIGFVFSSKGLMSNLTLEGSKISRMPD